LRGWGSLGTQPQSPAASSLHNAASAPASRGGRLGNRRQKAAGAAQPPGAYFGRCGDGCVPCSPHRRTRTGFGWKNRLFGAARGKKRIRSCVCGAGGEPGHDRCCRESRGVMDLWQREKGRRRAAVPADFFAISAVFRLLPQRARTATCSPAGCGLWALPRGFSAACSNLKTRQRGRGEPPAPPRAPGPDAASSSSQNAAGAEEGSALRVAGMEQARTNTLLNRFYYIPCRTPAQAPLQESARELPCPSSHILARHDHTWPKCRPWQCCQEGMMQTLLVACVHHSSQNHWHEAEALLTACSAGWRRC